MRTIKFKKVVMKEKGVSHSGHTIYVTLEADDSDIEAREAINYLEDAIRALSNQKKEDP